MRIAVASDDGARLSRHFGRAPYFVVVTVEDEEMVRREIRPKAHHGASSGYGPEAGHGAGAQVARHGAMIDAIQDCGVLLSGGMGEGAFNALRASGLEVAFALSDTVEDAVVDYLAGRTVGRHLCRH